jgi:hypothetical protein
MPRSRTEWQNDADSACAEAADAAADYSRAKDELELARDEQVAAQEAVEAARQEVEAAKAAVASAKASLASAQEELRRVQADREASSADKAAAREAVEAAREELSNAERELSEALEHLNQAQQELSEAERRVAETDRAFSAARQHVSDARSRLENVTSSAEDGLSKAEAARVPGGPARFSSHFTAAREHRHEETDFFRNLIDELNGALAELSNATSASPRQGRSSGSWAGSSGVSWRTSHDRGLPDLPPRFSGGGIGLPGMPGIGFKGVLDPPPRFAPRQPLMLGTTSQSYSPAWMRREGNELTLGFSTVAPPGALPFLGTGPVPTSSYLRLGPGTAGTGWTTPLGFGTAPSSYALSLGSPTLGFGNRGFDILPQVSLTPARSGLGLATGGSPSSMTGGIHSFDLGRGSSWGNACDNLSGGFGGGMGLGS